MKKINLLPDDYKIKKESKRLKKIVTITSVAIFLYTILSVAVIWQVIDILEQGSLNYNLLPDSSTYKKAIDLQEQLEELQALEFDLISAERQIESNDGDINILLSLVFENESFEPTEFIYSEAQKKISVKGYFYDDDFFQQYISYLNEIESFKEVKIVNMAYKDGINISVEIYIKDGVTDV